MKLTVNREGVFLDGHPIRHCTRVDIKKINPDDCMDVAIHVDVTEAEIQWSVKE